jgi:predicted DNA binding CopG/RHH family protein
MNRAKFIDMDELELAKSLETEEWVSDLTKKDKKRYEQSARTSLTKQRRINIRMTERDLKRIQAKAIEEGVPYQTLISMLIHKYNEGKVSIQGWPNQSTKLIPDHEARRWDQEIAGEKPEQTARLLEEAEPFVAHRLPRQPVSLRLDPQDLSLAKRIARGKGIPFTQLMAMWLHERIAQEGSKP